MGFSAAAGVSGGSDRAKISPDVLLPMSCVGDWGFAGSVGAAAVVIAGNDNLGSDGTESAVTSSGPSTRSLLDAAAGAGLSGSMMMTGCSPEPTSVLALAAAPLSIVIASGVSAGRVPVSPARRFANVSSLRIGTSMVCGTRRGAEIFSIDTMMWCTRPSTTRRAKRIARWREPECTRASGFCVASTIAVGSAFHKVSR